MPLKELVEECNKQNIKISCIIMKPNIAKDLFLDPSKGYFQELESTTDLELLRRGIFGNWNGIEIRVDKNLTEDIVPIYAYQEEVDNVI